MKDVCSPMNRPKGPVAGSPAKAGQGQTCPDLRRWRAVCGRWQRPARVVDREHHGSDQWARSVEPGSVSRSSRMTSLSPSAGLAPLRQSRPSPRRFVGVGGEGRVLP
jgi:hypothetical protein